MEKYKVSVVVLTYNPNEEKLRATLRSILEQKDICLQIIVADDGSAAPGMDAAQKLFEEYGFRDYVLVPNVENRGTVHNTHSGLEYCRGEFTKLISPGDLLSGSDVLRDWVGALELSGATVSCGEAIYYITENSTAKPVPRKAHPQQVDCYLKNNPLRARYNYLILDDLFLGAATLCRTAALHAYIDQILDKVIYAEDHIYRLMAYDRVPMHYFSKCCILYEEAAGISTSGNDFWTKKLEADWNAANQLLLDRCTGKDPIDKHLKKLIHLPKLGLKAKFIKYLTIPKALTYRLRDKCCPRYSELRFPNSR